MADSVKITSGSDATLQFAYKDDLGAVIAITAPVVIEAQGGLEGRCTASLVDGPNGLASVFIEGTSAIPVGTYALRLQATLTDGNTLASQRVLINVR